MIEDTIKKSNSTYPYAYQIQSKSSENAKWIKTNILKYNDISMGGRNEKSTQIANQKSVCVHKSVDILGLEGSKQSTTITTTTNHSY